LITRLIAPSSGTIVLKGEDLLALPASRMLEMRKTVQLVFQDPYSSLNPRKTVMQILSRPLEVHHLAHGWAAKRRQVLHLLRLVGLGMEHVDRYPHEFSGGQRQRIAIARAVAAEAKLIVLDEPVSALDVSIRAQIMSLLDDLQKRLGVSYLFIGHDLATVAYLSHRIAVMYLGRIVEVAESVELCSNPLHPYTKALFAAALPSYPDEVKEELVVTGEVPSALNPPSGCHFHPRCPMVMDHCPKLDPVLKEVAPNHWVACHLY
ncbi:MAG: ATP-binding cassette domain-containing protein, partial [Chloroflexi bacterium]|nr:ATP-binding cassette domain-containing protein [Chloroflexota bacterium]